MSKNSILAVMTFVLAVATTFLSCDRKTVFDKFTPVDGWERSDTVSFSISPMSADGTYKEEVALRMNATYPFMGICLIVDQRILPSDIRQSDTINCKLTDSKGKAKGRGLSCFQYAFHVNSLRLNKGDSLIISVRHNMKRETLPGIEDIGMRVSRE